MRTLLLSTLVLAGCAIGAPPGFSPGDHWTFPLVAPLSDDRLLTPVMVDGRGPFLFAIDPDAPISVMDRAVVGDKFAAHTGPRLRDEEDHSHPTFYVPITNLQVGDLTVSLATVALTDHDGAFDADGRRIYGILGRDVLADSLVFGFDRDRGIAWLETHDAFQTPADAIALPYRKGTNKTGGYVIRRLVTANIGGHDYELHLDLGDVSSQLWPKQWSEAGLRTIGWHQTLVDETGWPRMTEQIGLGTAHVGMLSRDVGFVPYVDHRWDLNGEIDGTLGLDFFRPYSVVADWHHETYYLTPRRDDALAERVRLGRWGSAVCAECVEATVVTDGPRTLLKVSRMPRQAGAAGKLEVVLAAGALPRLNVELPAGIDHLEVDVEPRYAGARLEVVDASPFLRACPTPVGCVLPDSPLAP